MNARKKSTVCTRCVPARRAITAASSGASSPIDDIVGASRRKPRQRTRQRTGPDLRGAAAASHVRGIARGAMPPLAAACMRAIIAVGVLVHPHPAPVDPVLQRPEPGALGLEPAARRDRVAFAGGDQREMTALRPPGLRRGACARRRRLSASGGPARTAIDAGLLARRLDQRRRNRRPQTRPDRSATCRVGPTARKPPASSASPVRANQAAAPRRSSPARASAAIGRAIVELDRVACTAARACARAARRRARAERGGRPRGRAHCGCARISPSRHQRERELSSVMPPRSPRSAAAIAPTAEARPPRAAADHRDPARAVRTRGTRSSRSSNFCRNAPIGLTAMACSAAPSIASNDRRNADIDRHEVVGDRRPAGEQHPLVRAIEPDCLGVDQRRVRSRS